MTEAEPGALASGKAMFDEGDTLAVRDGSSGMTREDHRSRFKRSGLEQSIVDRKDAYRQVMSAVHSDDLQITQRRIFQPLDL